MSLSLFYIINFILKAIIIIINFSKPTALDVDLRVAGDILLVTFSNNKKKIKNTFPESANKHISKIIVLLVVALIISTHKHIHYVQKHYKKVFHHKRN